MNSAKTTLLRIMNDIIDFNDNQPTGIYLYVDKKNIMKQYAMIVGPEGTPYFGGFFFFEISYPEDYPKNSPEVKFMTIDNKTRFNPNLYEGGKVCLSILGTWSGPSWTPVMNIRLVLISIRSLLSQYPIQNEPGYENTKPTDIMSIEYNQFIIYNTYRLAIINVLKQNFSKFYDFFEEDIKKEFEKNKNKLRDDILSYSTIYEKTEIGANSKIYFLTKQKLDFIDLLNQFNIIYDNFII